MKPKESDTVPLAEHVLVTEPAADAQWPATGITGPGMWAQTSAGKWINASITSEG